ncbi:hypothetical protein M419DRAFT_124834 [Trichoderma reesei RUT C-30]|uniref:Uncharacterized protein n=1 Tax=Hypocrea jecorina (strain ATCC 56765 / BCRC 32924 / NRRL 11460 / Rut C-30) TaxID=1344414 RepID=A0A024S1G6_HYPJR|nr:hypothetical protein M419DRAFT_124834 [Trichoderma reesei RUT C-30]
MSQAQPGLPSAEQHGGRPPTPGGSFSLVPRHGLSMETPRCQVIDVQPHHQATP